MAYQDEVTQEELQAGFDKWAQTYDRDVGRPSDNFPFAGYAQALQTVWEQSQAEPGMTVLDLGVGTGNLAKFFVEAGWAIEYLPVSFCAGVYLFKAPAAAR